MTEPGTYTIEFTYGELLAVRVAMDHWMHNCDTLYSAHNNNKHSKSCESSSEKMDDAWVGRPK